jgi:hypothetical protein
MEDSDPLYIPAAVRIARPLIDAFASSTLCPQVHRWHARSTLPVLALFVAMLDETSPARLPWEALSPDSLMAASLDADHEELGFLRDLLDVSASFYVYLGSVGIVPQERARTISKRLTQVALGVRSAA